MSARCWTASPLGVRDFEHHPAGSEWRVYRAMTDVMTRRLTGTSTPTWRGA
ncbi:MULTISPECIES: hypothetical protein [Nonomuraea]|uniref:Uncharacterized protein n=1 Tax=Nonomuraea mangrovi TaxID=2316207 RepID=A0ABW4T0H1_9ACTN